MPGTKTFKECAVALDAEVTELPELETWLQPEYDWKQPTDDLKGFIEKLKDVLECLGAEDVTEQFWHRYALNVSFRPCNSPYFELGSIVDVENVIAHEDLEGSIGIGFDEGLDYENKKIKPELIISYHGGLGSSFSTGMYLFDVEKWRKAIREFFNYKAAIN